MKPEKSLTTACEKMHLSAGRSVRDRRIHEGTAEMAREVRVQECLNKLTNFENLVVRE
jgi:hypothetical protein